MPKTEAKMLIVTPDRDVGLIVFATPNVEHDMAELVTREMAEILGKLQPPDAGVWVWEGWQHYETRRNYFDDDDVDVEYTGTWRRPTEIEVGQLVRGESPWPREYCSDCDEEVVGVHACEKAQVSK